MFETNEVLQKLPDHLKNLIIDQPYNEYTAQDHAVWRYVMRQNVHYLKDVAHESYLDGLKKTGISIEQIPHMYGMNRILKEIGWAAVAVDGFIPPSAFMEFQAYNVLVIAADIRPIDQIAYTPAPDIIHEAAGHAPIIADPEYAEYLRLFGKYGSKAFSSIKDKELYLAIRHLSILKADPYSSKEDIELAEKELFDLENSIAEPSEIRRIRNLHWWTVEYGLIGDLKQPRIYGAGLLSSIGESKNALSDKVTKLPYGLDAMNTGFDITCMQPQLFVTPDFKHLTQTLEDFAQNMAFKTGGLSGIEKAINSESIACVEYSSGLQVSGKVATVTSDNEEVHYIQMAGPTSLSFNGQELEGHHKEYHKEGFGSPVGKLKNVPERFSMFTDDELQKKGFIIDKPCDFEFESGIRVKGTLRKVIRKNFKIILMSFSECVVTYQNHILFFPDWGMYDMAVGEKIVSVSNGPADPKNYGYTFEAPEEKTHKIEHNDGAKSLHKVYQKVRELRITDYSTNDLSNIINKLNEDQKKDWLLMLELYELASQNELLDLGKKDSLKKILEKLADESEETKQLISDGLQLIQQKIPVVYE